MTKQKALVLMAAVVAACTPAQMAQVTFYKPTPYLPQSLAGDDWTSLRDGWAAACQGVFVSPHEILTAAHCTVHAHGYRVLSRDLVKDIARLRSPLPVLIWAKVSKTIPTEGYTYRGPVVIGHGTFIGEAYPGDSGSGIFGPDGGLVGIITGCKLGPDGACILGQWSRP